MNNRKDTGTKLTEKYRISIKEINGKMYTRLDFDPAFNNGVFRSVITDGNEVIVFDTKTEKIEQRIPIAKGVSQDLKTFAGETTLGRVNLSRIKSEAMRLSFDMAESTEDNILSINLPSALFQNNGRDKRVSTRICYDTENETLLDVEIVETEEDGTEVTTTNQQMYEESEGEPVKIGEITVIEAKAPELLKGFDANTTIINTPDDVPTIDPSAADRMVAEGTATLNDNVTFGDPADLSNTVTQITLCKDIQINQTSDRVFKIITGGK